MARSFSITPPADGRRGSRTVIKGGEPLVAIKTKNKITARELEMESPDQQRARASGRMPAARAASTCGTKRAKASPRTRSGATRSTLVKDREGERIYDLLTLTVDAAFLDDEHDQELHAQRIQVWLEPPDDGAAPDTSPAMKEMAPGPSGQRPHKLEAFEHVRTRSADLIVHDTDHLIVRFKDCRRRPRVRRTRCPRPPPDRAGAATDRDGRTTVGRDPELAA